MTAEIIEFNPFKLAGFNLQDRVNSLEIKEFDDIEIAKNVLKECTGLEKRIEDVRTSITKPVNDILKNINNMAKEVALPVNEAKLNIKQKIVDFNEAQERIKKLEEQRIAKIITGMSSIMNTNLLLMYANSLDEKDQNNFIIKTAIQAQSVKIEEKQRAEEEAKIRAEEERQLAENKKKQSEEQAKLDEERVKLEREKREMEENKRIEAEKKALEEKEKIVEQIQNTETDKVKGMRTQMKREVLDEEAVPRFLCSPDSKKINEYIKSGVVGIPLKILGLKVREEKTVQ